MRRLRVLAIALLVVGLILAALGLQGAIDAHCEAVRGQVEGFSAPIDGANVPTLGVNVALEQYDEEDLHRTLSQIADGGFVWVRQTFYWHDIEAEDGRYDWSGPDRLFEALKDYPQLRLVAALDDDPPVPPADPDRFAAFAGAFADRYGQRVGAYQVWDEPNLGAHWGGGPVDPAGYADLLARTARAIRAADPSARILLAGLAPTVETGPQNLSDVRFLDALYEAGAGPYFDVVAGKPYGFASGPGDRRADEQVLNFSRLILLREVMVEHGDGDKALWASHWGWNALPEDWTGRPSIWGQVDPVTQANWTVQALERARTEWPWAGAMVLSHWQPPVAGDDPLWGFALVDRQGDPRPVYDAVSAWAEALPDAAPVGGHRPDAPWVEPMGEWLVGPLGASAQAPGARMTFRFDGTGVALTVRRGPYRGTVFVTVDGDPKLANQLSRDAQGRAYIPLYDEESTVATVPIARDLPSGVHTVEIEMDHGVGQWSVVDWRAGVEPVGDRLDWGFGLLLVLGLGLLGLLTWQLFALDWRRMGAGFLDWPEWAQWALPMASIGLFWWAMGAHGELTWTSPWLIVGLATLLPLPVLFAWRIDVGLALVALTIPFYQIPRSLHHQGLSVLHVLIFTCVLAWAVRRLVPGLRSGRKRRALPPVVGLDWGWAALLGVAALTSLAAVVWPPAGVAIDDPWSTLFNLWTVFCIPAMVYVLLRLVDLRSDEGHRILVAFIVGGVFLAAVGLVQYGLGRGVSVAEGGLPRLGGVYHSPNNMALYLGRVWPLLVALTLFGSAEGRWRAGLGLGIVSLALILTFSRGALLLGLPAAILVMGWRAGGRVRWAALLVVVIVLLLFVPLFQIPRFASLFDFEEGSSFFRLKLWRSTLTMIVDHPWLGVGTGNFQTVYQARYILPEAWAEPNRTHPHNVYLDHWVRMGILGLVVGIALQLAFWRRVWEGGRGDPWLLGLAGAGAALLAHGLVDNALFFTDLAVAFALATGYVAARSTELKT